MHFAIVALSYSAVAVVSGFIGNKYGPKVASEVAADYLKVKAAASARATATLAKVEAEVQAEKAKLKSIL